MKKMLVMLASLVIACISQAETSVSTNIWSKYVSSHSALFSDKPVLQTTVSQSFGNGGYAYLFHSVGLDDNSWSSNFGDEIDYCLGWTGGKIVKVDVNIAYWDLCELLKSSTTDIVAVNIALSHKIDSDPLKGTIGLCLGNYIPVDSKFWKHGCRGFAFYSTQLKVTNKTSLACKVQLVRDDGALRSNPSFVGGMTLGLNWKVGDINLTFPQMKKTWVISKVYDGRKNQIAWGGGASLSF